MKPSVLSASPSLLVLACVAGACSYTLISSRWVAVLLGGFLLAGVPMRRLLRRARRQFSQRSRSSAAWRRSTCGSCCSDCSSDL